MEFIIPKCPDIIGANPPLPNMNDPPPKLPPPPVLEKKGCEKGSFEEEKKGSVVLPDVDAEWAWEC